MPDTPKQPRLWRILGLGAAAIGIAVTHAAAFAPAAGPADEQLWQVQVEAGEAGEDDSGEAGQSGLAPERDQDAAFATRLALVDASLRAAIEADAAGLAYEATELATYPETELMQVLREDLVARGGTDFSDQVDAFVETLESDASGTDLQAAYGAVTAPLTKALDALPARARFEAIRSAVLAAAEEQEEKGQAIRVRGYLAAAGAIAERLAQDADAAVAEAGNEASFTLSEAEGELAEMPDDITILRAVAAQIEFAALQFR